MENRSEREKLRDRKEREGERKTENSHVFSVSSGNEKAYGLASEHRGAVSPSGTNVAKCAKYLIIASAYLPL